MNLGDFNIKNLGKDLLQSKVLSDFVNNFIEGVKKVAKPVLVYVFATTLFITTYFFGFPITFINMFVQ